MSAGASVELMAVGTWSLPDENGAEAVADAVLAKSEAEQRADALLAEMIAAREEQAEAESDG